MLKKFVPRTLLGIFSLLGVMVAGYFVDGEKTSRNFYSIGLGSIFAQGV